MRKTILFILMFLLLMNIIYAFTCVQENAFNNSCYNDIGFYEYIGNVNGENNGNSGSITITYFKPSGFLNATFEFKRNNETVNLSIPYECSLSNNITLRLQLNFLDYPFKVFCFNNSYEWQLLYIYDNTIGSCNWNSGSDVLNFSQFLEIITDNNYNTYANIMYVSMNSFIKNFYGYGCDYSRFYDERMYWNICSPSWYCSSYGSCQTNNLRYCNEVTDLNNCGVSYAGDYSEFTPLECGNTILFFSDNYKDTENNIKIVLSIFFIPLLFGAIIYGLYRYLKND